MQRTRTTGGITSITQEFKTLTCAGSLSTSYGTTPYYNKGAWKQTTDVVGVGYHRRRRNGEIIVNPFSTHDEEHKCSGFYWKIARSGSCTGSTIKEQSGDAYITMLPSGASVCPSLIADSVRSRLVTEAGTNALAGARRPQVAGMVEIAEAKQIPGIFTGPFRRLSKVMDNTIAVLDKIEKGKAYGKYARKHGKSLGKFIAGGWLTYRYGLMPLLSSGEDAINALKEETGFKHVRTSKSSKFTDAEYVEYSDSTGGSNFEVARSATSRQEMSVVAGVLYDVVLSRFGQFGMSAMDIPETAWELIPYSFVVDWFVNVGDLIATLPRPNQKIRASWHGIKDERVTEVNHVATWKNVANYSPVSYPHGQATFTVTRYTRLPYISSGLTFRVNPFGDFDLEPKTKRIGDAVALITNKLLEGISPGNTGTSYRR